MFGHITEGQWYEVCSVQRYTKWPQFLLGVEDRYLHGWEKMFVRQIGVLEGGWLRDWDTEGLGVEKIAFESDVKLLESS